MAYIQKLIAQCDLCGHQWIPSIDFPLHCAKCKSRLWNGTTRKTKEN